MDMYCYNGVVSKCYAFTVKILIIMNLIYKNILYICLYIYIVIYRSMLVDLLFCFLCTQIWVMSSAYKWSSRNLIVLEFAFFPLDILKVL